MLKALEIVAVLAAIVFAVTLFGLIVLYSSQPSNEPEQQQSSEKYEPGQDKREFSKSFWLRTTQDPVAFFTLWLAIFTMILSAVAVLQIKFLVRSEGIAINTAQAAKDSAAARQSSEAVGNVERPYIFVIAKPVTLAPKDGPDDQSPQISYTATNMGRVPAVVRLIYSVCKLVEKLDSQQTVDAAKFRPALTAIQAGLTNSEFPICTFEKPITAEDWADIRADKKMTVFEAIFAYEGALDSTYITSLAYKIDLFSGHAFVIGGSARNYDQKQQGRLSETGKITFPKVSVSPVPEPPPPANSTLPNQ
jgi:hypothetical protein